MFHPVDYGPCVLLGKNSKKPCTDTWTLSQDSKEVDQWLSRGHNIGIATGYQVVVVDIDGDQGLRSLKRLDLKLPKIPLVKTPNGYHLYFKRKQGVTNRVGIFPDIDIRGEDGYVVAPPSPHYHWVNPPDTHPLIELPKEFTQSRPPTRFEVPKFVLQGQRNDSITRIFGKLLSHFEADVAVTLIEAYNQHHCQPPLPDKELKTIMKSITQRELKKRKSQ